VVTDDRVLALPDFAAMARAVFEAGREGVAVQLRGPRTVGRSLFEIGTELARLAAESGGRLLVNDRIDVALACGAHGVHLGGRSLPPEDARRLAEESGASFLIGASAHDPEEAAVAAAGGADYLFAGSVFPTPSHPGRRPLGLEGLAEVRQAAGGRAVLGIGGITPERAEPVLAAGGWGVAVLRGVWDAPDPAGAVRAYLAALRPPGADRDPSG
jgi:thiamine-phosphate pyrophosphorylase